MSLLAFTLIAFSLVFLLGSSYVLFASAFFPPTGLSLLDTLTHDDHYKYFFLFLVPTTAYFVIARWTGWQYFVSS